MSNSQQNYTSLGFFNQVRGVGIFWVVLGHSITLYLTPQMPAVVIPVFSAAGRVLGGGIMAMFFMISGFYFYRRSFSKCVATQARLLLKPYIITGIAVIVCNIWLSLLKGTKFMEYTAGMVLTYLLGLNSANKFTLWGVDLKSVSVFWFLLALFVGWVLYNCLLGIKNKWFRSTIIVACVVSSWALMKLTKVWPMVLPNGLLAVGYIAAGHLIREQKLLERKLSLIQWLIVGGLALVSLAFGLVDISSGTWKLGLLDVAGSFCVAFLLLRIHDTLARRQWGGFFMKTLERIGRNSIWIICLHTFEKEVIPWNRLKQMFPDHPLLCMALCFAGRCAIMLLLWVVVSHLRKLYRSRRYERIIITEE